MRLFVWLAVLMTLLAASPPAAAAGRITLELTPQKGAHGDTVEFAGEGFTPGAEVVVVMTDDGIIVATVQADANASIHGSFTVPARSDLPGVQGSTVPVYAIEPGSGRESERTSFEFVEPDAKPAGLPSKVVVTVELTSPQRAHANSTYWVVMGAPNMELVTHRLADPEGDGIYVFASEVAAGTPFTARIVEGRGTRETQYGQMPGDPLTTIRDFGTFVPHADVTLSATTGTRQGRVPVRLPSTGGGWGDGLRRHVAV